MMDELRYAFRQLRTRPAFAAVAVATLAVGIGTAAAMFGLIQGVLLSPPPYAAPDRLVLVAPVRVDGQPFDRGADGRPVAGLAQRAQPRADRAVPLDLQLPGPRRRQPVARRHGRDPRLLRRRRRAAAAGPHLHGGRGEPAAAPGSSQGAPPTRDCPRLRPLAARVRRRSGHRRQGGHAQPDAGAAAGRRRDAARACASCRTPARRPSRTTTSTPRSTSGSR